MEKGLNWISQPAARTNLVLESIAHAVTGSIFWLVCLCNLTLNDKYEFALLKVIESTFYAGFFAVIVDIDHFIAAGSLSMHAARNLSGRPFLHWTGGLLLVALLLTLLSFLAQPGWRFRDYCLPFGWIALVAWCSHQLRDSLRRGLWLWPPPNLHSLVSDEFAFSIPPIPLPIAYSVCLTGLAVGLLPWLFRHHSWTGGFYAPLVSCCRNHSEDIHII